VLADNLSIYTAMTIASLVTAAGAMAGCILVPLLPELVPASGPSAVAGTSTEPQPR
jgi:hypothetical protein